MDRQSTTEKENEQPKPQILLCTNELTYPQKHLYWDTPFANAESRRQTEFQNESSSIKIQVFPK